VYLQNIAPLYYRIFFTNRQPLLSEYQGNSIYCLGCFAQCFKNLRRTFYAFGNLLFPMEKQAKHAAWNPITVPHGIIPL